MKEETELVSVAQEPGLIDDCLVSVTFSPFQHVAGPRVERSTGLPQI